MTYTGRVVHGAGGASKAFLFDNARRQKELSAIVGYLPHPGTLNVRLTADFDFTAPHLTGIVDAKKNEVRMYPVLIDGKIEGHVIRFKGAKYSPRYVGLVAAVRLRDHVGHTVTVRHRNAESPSSDPVTA